MGLKRSKSKEIRGKRPSSCVFWIGACSGPVEQAEKNSKRARKAGRPDTSQKPNICCTLICRSPTSVSQESQPCQWDSLHQDILYRDWSLNCGKIWEPPDLLQESLGCFWPEVSPRVSSAAVRVRFRIRKRKRVNFRQILLLSPTEKERKHPFVRV